ncbi:MAG: hypothetical protein MI924_08965 [Chloroflexales bacterium]|nr:hypothetical protein [Chloroflexales bacterium]
MSPLQGEGDTLSPVLTEPKLVEALRLTIDIFRDFSPSQQLDSQNNDQQPAALIDTGQVGMWLTSNVVADTDSEAAKRPFTTGFAPLFSNGAASRVAIYPKGRLYIPSSTEKRQACWEFISALSRDRTNIQKDFPARISLAESQDFYSQMPAETPSIYAAYRPMFDLPPNDPYPHTTIANFWFLRVVDRALQGADVGRELSI